MPDEEWRPIVGWSEYEVSSLGRVRRGHRILVGGRSRKRNGYPTVTCCQDGRQATMPFHKLVAEAFLGPRPDGLQVNHKDGVKSNNAAANLEYVSPSENHLHASRLGLKPKGHNHHWHLRPECNQGIRNGNAKLTPDKVAAIRGWLVRGLTQRAVAREFGISRSTVQQIRSGMTWPGVEPN